MSSTEAMLKLHNFKCWKDKSISFHNSSTLLHGQSGSGKSTILLAISYALYGKVKKPTTKGEKKCSVQLSFPWIQIKRTHGPNTLSVSTNDMAYKNEVAQSVIDEMFGTFQRFSFSSFIQQKSNSSIVSLTSMEQLSVIESLCFDTDQSFKTIKNKINAVVSTNVNFLRDIEVRKSTLEEMVGNDDVKEEDGEYIFTTKDKLENEKKQLEKVLTGSINNDEILTDTLRELELKDAKLKGEMVQYNTILTKPSLIDNEDSICNKMLKRSIESTKLRKEYEELENEYNSKYNDYQEFSKSEIERVEGELNEMTEERANHILNLPMYRSSQKEVEKESKEFISELKTKYKIKARLLSTVLKAATKLHDTTTTDIKKEEDEFTRLRKLIEQKEILSKEYSCPSCSSKVVIVDGELTSSSAAPIITTLEKEFRNSKKKISTLRTTQLDLATVVAELELFREILEHKETTTIEECARARKYLAKRPKLLKTLEKYKTPSSNVLLLKDQRDEAKEKYESGCVCVEINNAQEELKLRKEKEKARQELDRITKILEETSLKITAIKESLDIVSENTANRKRLAEIEVQLQELSIRQMNLDKWKSHKRIKEQLSTVKKERDRLLELVEKAKSFKKLCVDSQICVLRDIIECINECAKFYLDRMFDEPISMSLKYVKQDDTIKNLKIKIYTVLNYKGTEYDSIDELSGGERDRVNLAYTLALNELMNSRILMLDETLSSLDLDTKSDVMTMIKSKFTNVIVVSHGIDHSLFDKVVSF